MWGPDDEAPSSPAPGCRWDVLPPMSPSLLPRIPADLDLQTIPPGVQSALNQHAHGRGHDRANVHPHAGALAQEHGQGHGQAHDQTRDQAAPGPCGQILHQSTIKTDQAAVSVPVAPVAGAPRPKREWEVKGERPVKAEKRLSSSKAARDEGLREQGRNIKRAILGVCVRLTWLRNMLYPDHTIAGKKGTVKEGGVVQLTLTGDQKKSNMQYAQTANLEPTEFVKDKHQLEPQHYRRHDAPGPAEMHAHFKEWLGSDSGRETVRFISKLRSMKAEGKKQQEAALYKKLKGVSLCTLPSTLCKTMLANKTKPPSFFCGDENELGVKSDSGTPPAVPSL